MEKTVIKGIDELIGNLVQNTLFLGDRGILLNKVKNIFTSESDSNTASNKPKVTWYEIEKLNISVDDVRRMISFVSKTSEGQKVVLLSSFYWAEESQNAMLKTLEETPKNTLIFLFGLNEKFFLKTVLSRVQKYHFEYTNRYNELAKEILSALPNERLDNSKVKKILSLKTVDYSYEKNAESEKKDREAHMLFLQALVNKALENRIKFEKSFLEKLLIITTLADIEGGSPHLFIEWLLLSLPKFDMV
jgi:DNA polymerase-3 subunit delta'